MVLFLFLYFLLTFVGYYRMLSPLALGWILGLRAGKSPHSQA